MHSRFSMNIQDVFYFKCTVTVFAGDITDGPPFIRGGLYEISIGDKTIGCVLLDGERSLGHVPNIRSLSTSQPLTFDGDILKGCNVVFSNTVGL